MSRKQRCRLVTTLGVALITLAAQVRADDIGTAFTYQGYLEKPAGTPVNAVAPNACNFEFSLWDAAGSGSPPTGGSQIGTTQSVAGVPVINGVFTVGPPDIDFGDLAFDGAARWLEIHVKCPPDVVFTALAPRVELTPAPYALRAAQGVGPPGALEVAPTGQLNLAEPGMANQLSFDPGNWTMAAFSDTGPAPLTIEARSSENGDRTQLILDGASYSATFAGEAVAANTAGLTPPPKLRISLETAATTAGPAGPSVSLAAYDANDVTPVMLRLKSGNSNTLNVTPAGRVGIATDAPTERLDVAGNIHASGTITSGSTITIDGTGGSENIISSASLDLRTAAGRALRLENNATSPNLIGGYSGNAVSLGVEGGTVGGGGDTFFPNQVTDPYGTVGGGRGNRAGNNDPGLDQNYATVGGGVYNIASGYSSAVGGGQSNTVSGNYSTIGGGENNYAGSVCVGGVNNGLRCDDGSDCPAGTCPVISYSTVGGGRENTATNEQATVGGGGNNTASGNYSTVGGGRSNAASAAYATIAGGGESTPGTSTTANRVTDDYGTVGGGGNNQAGDNAGTTSDKIYATVGGGISNTASGNYSTVGGGNSSTASGFDATVGGGGSNIASNTGSTVGGGGTNTASGINSIVGGGAGNTANGDGSTIGGGEVNIARGIYSAVPGGRENEAGGHYSFAAGRRAKVRDPVAAGNANGDEGTFVWADSTAADFTSTGSNQFLIRASGNVGIGTNAPTGKLHISSSGNDQIVLSHPTTTGFPQITFQTTAGVNDSSITYDQANDLLYLANGLAARLVITNSGNVGIGTSAPNVALDVIGDIEYTGTITDVSDERLKENIAPVQDALAKVRQLRGVYFNMKDSPNEREIGLLAQDVQEALPEAVSIVDPHTGFLGVSYPSLIPLLVEAIKEMQTKVATIDADGVALAAIQGLYQIVQEKDCEIEKLGSEISNLESEITDLKTLVNKLAAQQNGGGR